MRWIGCCILFLSASVWAAEKTHLTADWAEHYIKQQHPSLLHGSESDHVISVYYFGQFNNRSLMGLERVRGEQYEQFFTILVFENDYLLGFYKNALSFPSSINAQGEVGFPYGIEGKVKTSGVPLNLAVKEFGDLCQTQAQITQCFSWQSVPYKKSK